MTGMDMISCHLYDAVLVLVTYQEFALTGSVTLLFILAALILRVQLTIFINVNGFLYLFIAVEAVLKTEHRIDGSVLNIGRYQEKRTVVDEVS